MRYRNIIFDFGNVLASFSMDDLMMKTMGYRDEELKRVLAHDWDKLDGGLIEYEDYIAECKKMSEKHEEIDKFFARWYLLLEESDEVKAWIKELKKKGYHLYILSNAPEIFEKNVHSYDIVSDFDGMVYSGRIKIAKPHDAIYKYLLEKYDLKPEECFFLDDKLENVEAAIECGIDARVFKNNLKEIREIIKE